MLLLVVGTVQLGDSTGPVTGLDEPPRVLLQVANAQLDSAARLNGRGVTWVGLEEQRRAQRRNPTLGLTPDLLTTEYLLGPTVDHVPDPLWGQVRTLGALTGARFAVAPAVVRITGHEGAFVATYVIVVVDVRTGEVMFRARTAGQTAPTAVAAIASAADAVIAKPIQ